MNLPRCGDAQGAHLCTASSSLFPALPLLLMLSITVTAGCDDPSVTIERVRAHSEGKPIINDVLVAPPPRERQQETTP